MDPAALKRYKEVLRTIRLALSERVARKRGARALGTLTARVRHMDRPAGHEAAIRRLADDSALLLRVEAAIRRADQGRYGVCLLCRKPVSRHHLDALPWAAFCIPCRKIVDSREALLAWSKDR